MEIQSLYLYYKDKNIKILVAEGLVYNLTSFQIVDHQKGVSS